MNNEQIIEIARRYGSFYDPDDEFTFGQEDLIAFTQAVIDAERESSDEPVAWLGLLDDFCLYNKLYFDKQDALDDGHSFVEPLYRHPPPARKMTDEEITEIMLANGFTIKDGCDKLKPYVFQAVRAIERRINGEEE